MMHLLHSVDSLALANGGLPLAVCELASALAANEGHEKSPGVDLISSKCSQPCFHPDQVKLITAGNPTREWRKQMEAAHRQQSYTLVHQHGIWVASSHTTAAFTRHHNLPLVVSPHGMLEPWALNHHAWRKRIALALYQRRILKQAKAFHATCGAEAEHIRQLGFSQPIAVVPNGVSIPEPPSSIPDPQEHRTALFLSRLHPKKGVPMLLEAWAKINPPNWRLVISGYDEDNHLAELKHQTEQLGLSSVISFPGPLFDQAKNNAFHQAELFILPSHSENFGIVIAEALASGLPVITTRETPWQILEQQNCGWWIDASVEAIASALKQALQLSPSELQAMGQRGKNLVEEKFLWPRIAKQMLQFYHWLIDEAEKPDYVI